MPPPGDWTWVVLKQDCPWESHPDPGAHPSRAGCVGGGGAVNLHLQAFRRRFRGPLARKAEVADRRSLPREEPPELCACRWAPSLRSMNTRWAAVCDDSKMKHKGEIKYIKALLRRTARFSLSLAWFRLCPGHVGTVLIPTASAFLTRCHFIAAAAILPAGPFPSVTPFRPNQTPRTDARVGAPSASLSPSSSGAFHALSPPGERRAEAVLLASFSYILKRLETASAELTFDRVTGEKEKISGEATHGDLGLPSEGRLGLPYCQTRCLFR